MDGVKKGAYSIQKKVAEGDPERHQFIFKRILEKEQPVVRKPTKKKSATEEGSEAGPGHECKKRLGEATICALKVGDQGERAKWKK